MNNSGRCATAWWINFCGEPISYGDIPSEETLKMNTFLTHPWIFRATESGAVLTANQLEVYYPTPSEYLDYIPVKITAPVYALREYCLMEIRRLVRKEDFNKLDIPKMLKEDLSRPPSVMDDVEKLNSNTVIRATH